MSIQEAMQPDSTPRVRRSAVFACLGLCFHCLVFLGFSGCATLNLNTDEAEELSQEDLESDPIARVALQYRNESPSARTRKRESEEKHFGLMQQNGILTLGMPQEEVLSLWGEPTEIQIAGDPSTRNEKWTYYEGLSSSWGLSAARDIYFEHGRVAGWENRVRQ